MPSTDLIGAEKAAEILRIHPRTLRHRIAAGKIEPAGKLPGTTGAYLFHRSVIEALAKAEARAAS